MGQDYLEKGKTFYDKRAAKTNSLRADPENINKAISAFTKSVESGSHPEESAVYLLKSYYFKGMFTGQTDDQKKEIYDKGRDFGEKMIKKYPDSVPLKFWYGANIGRWAKVHGFINAATNGIAPKLRRLSKKIIELDPQYQGGGGYRILAQVHFYSPSIPLVMGWPSDEKALELIEKAMNIAPNHPTNRMLYAEVLLEFDRDEEAKKHLQFILDMKPRPSHRLEDQYVQQRSRKLLKEHFDLP